MRGARCFGDLIKPIHDEIFLSWINRGLRSKRPTPFLQSEDYINHTGIKDIDFHLGSVIVKDLSGLLGLSTEKLVRTFLPFSHWLIMPRANRNVFCEHCLMEDFYYGRQPSTRISWCYWWFNICPVHLKTLTPINANSASEALLSLLKWTQPSSKYAPWPAATPRDRWRSRSRFTLLLSMALSFQQWYMASIVRKKILIGSKEIQATHREMEGFMGDILAIIGKKRNIPFEDGSLIAHLLDIRSWSSLNVSLPRDAGCEAFLCLDIGEHPPPVRMAMFGLLGLMLKLPYCMEAWRVLRDPRIDDEVVQWLWRDMLGGGEGLLGNYDWLENRANGWSVAVKNQFCYLLNPPHGNVRLK